MIDQYKTPGVYVEELDAFPPSIIGVETAVPVFIGYTEKAERNGQSCRLQPVRIGLMVEYRAIFGDAYRHVFKFTAVADDARPEDRQVILGGKFYKLDIEKRHDFDNSLRLFYANGGGNCYIVSAGSYDDAPTLAALIAGLDAVRDLAGPTMLVFPEATALANDDYATLIAAMLRQCSDKRDRVAILDVPTPGLPADFAAAIDSFRKKVADRPSQHLKYGMAYCPFLRTSVIDPTELDYTNFAEFGSDKNNPTWTPGALTWAILRATNELYPDADGVTADTTVPSWLPAGTTLPADVKSLTAKTREIGALYVGKIKAAKGMEKGPDKNAEIKKINQGLSAQVPVLKDIYAAMAAKLGVLPPSAAIAGVYTQTDTLRGVWNAPANVGLAAVTGPTVAISSDMQDDLNRPIDGLAINALRDFVGRGTLVWGAHARRQQR